MSNDPLPLAVTNLRKIWAQKKQEMKFTQIEAAAQIGFTQGAISQYLNNLTKLGPQTTIKFANFLDVDPRCIDPTIVKHLPNTKTVTCTRSSDNGSKVIHKELHGQRKPETTLNMELVGDIQIEGAVAHPIRKNDGFFVQAYVQLVPLSSHPQCKLVAVQLKKEKNVRFFYVEAKPAAKDIKQIWAVASVSYST